MDHCGVLDTKGNMGNRKAPFYKSPNHPWVETRFTIEVDEHTVPDRKCLSLISVPAEARILTAPVRRNFPGFFASSLR